ncbi:JmjC domain-containing protein [Arenimonas sp.]|uniref:JmjC domain-containing protein n=1 Tax=Arenimonas sp. TaxID=1872635 RepID=UPI0039E5377E
MIEVAASKKHPLGMPIADFLRDYWQKKPLLIRQAFPGYVAPLAPEDLAGLACEEAALARLVTYHRRKNVWTLRNGPFAEEEFPGLGDKDWTLLVQDMDKWDADVRALLTHFRFLPAWRVDDVMISFATPGGSVGPHVDQYDVFLLQALGRRRWQIDVDPDAPRDFRPDVELKLLQRFAPSHDWVLEPGDMLYLPPGVPHHGEAVDACMTFSIGMRAPSQAELVVDLAEELAAQLPEESRYADPDLLAPDDAFEIGDDAMARVEGALSALRTMDEAQTREWFGRFITRYRASGEIAPPTRTPSFADATKALGEGGLLLRHPFARAAWSRLGRKARLFVNGESHAMGQASAKLLAAAESLDAGALDRLDEAGREAVASLLTAGVYQLQRAKRARRGRAG